MSETPVCKDDPLTKIIPKKIAYPMSEIPVCKDDPLTKAIPKNISYPMSETPVCKDDPLTKAVPKNISYPMSEIPVCKDDPLTKAIPKNTSYPMSEAPVCKDDPLTKAIPKNITYPMSETPVCKDDPLTKFIPQNVTYTMGKKKPGGFDVSKLFKHKASFDSFFPFLFSTDPSPSTWCSATSGSLLQLGSASQANVSLINRILMVTHYPSQACNVLQQKVKVYSTTNRKKKIWTKSSWVDRQIQFGFFNLTTYPS